MKTAYEDDVRSLSKLLAEMSRAKEDLKAEAGNENRMALLDEVITDLEDARRGLWKIIESYT